MQNKFVKNIKSSVKILIILLIIFTLIIAKSIFLLSFITVLSLIILILLGNSVNKYVEFIKKIFIWLLFIVIMYIIIFRNVNGLSIFMYKLILSIILIDNLLWSLNFGELHSGIYAIIYPLKRFNINREQLSYRISLNLIFVCRFIRSGNRIEKMQLLRNKRNCGMKYFIIPKLLDSINYVDELDESLKLKFYRLRIKKVNIKSVFLLMLFIVLFILALFKEVIL